MEGSHLSVGNYILTDLHLKNMHFNNKYINQGDSEKEIKDKVNYNFNQVLSFAVGHEGYIGPKGATGIPGPSGKIGGTGNTGDRASEWFRGTVVPLAGSSQEFDLWVDDSSALGDIYERDTSSWSYTGLSLFNSDYFEVYSGIVGPLGLTDKSAIGFNSSYTPDQTSLVISDTYFSSLDVNPNNSKLLVATGDQIDTPIFSFSKSNGSSTIDPPSFYWKNTGTLSDLIFKSPGKLSINSLLDLEISSDDLTIGGSLIISGNSFSSTTQGNLNLIGDNRISLIASNSSISPIIINSLNFGVNESKLYTKTLTKISQFIGFPGNYALKSTPIAGSTFNYFGGISINSDSTSARVFDFTGMDGHSVLYGSPLGSVTSGNHKQTVFGVSGGVSTGSTGAPYSYHVKRLNNISVIASPGLLIPYSKRNKSRFLISDFVSLSTVLNLISVSLWNSNMIVATSNTVLSDDAYVIIPSATTSSFEPLFYSGEGNEYRVYLNDMNGSRKIKGIIYSYIYETTLGALLNRLVYIDFVSSCSYVDLSWAYIGSSTNPNGRIFWKTCKGEGGILESTNQFTIAGNTAPTFPVSS
jgi:hypothetical protein